jgi:hypothetical protein
MSGYSYRIDETYVKVGREWEYLYRAVDSAGSTIEFMLSAKRDISAAKRFFKKMMRADHRRLPFTIGTDKHASYPEAFAVSVKEKVLPPDCKLRRVKYLNNVIEQDHRGHCVKYPLTLENSAQPQQGRRSGSPEARPAALLVSQSSRIIAAAPGHESSLSARYRAARSPVARTASPALSLCGLPRSTPPSCFTTSLGDNIASFTPRRSLGS